jgi:hypothetical protein
LSETDIAIVDLADDLQVRKQRIFKVLARLGIRSNQRREPSRGNQNVATISRDQAAIVRAEIEKSTSTNGTSSRSGWVAGSSADDVGFFYLIELEPEHDPGRYKVGFTMDLDGRLRKHRCSAPFAKYVQTWLCKRVWERAAIDCATEGAKQLHTEVFRCESLSQVSKRLNSFFAVMPSLEEFAPDVSEEPELT